MIHSTTLFPEIVVWIIFWILKLPLRACVYASACTNPYALTHASGIIAIHWLIALTDAKRRLLRLAGVHDDTRVECKVRTYCHTSQSYRTDAKSCLICHSCRQYSKTMALHQPVVWIGTKPLSLELIDYTCCNATDAQHWLICNTCGQYYKIMVHYVPVASPMRGVIQGNWPNTSVTSRLMRSVCRFMRRVDSAIAKCWIFQCYQVIGCIVIARKPSFYSVLYTHYSIGAKIFIVVFRNI